MKKTDFLNTVVFGWMKSDLERMITNIRPDKTEVGNINFPLALCTLSYMEYLGGFLLGKDDGFFGNVDSYTSECFPNVGEYPTIILKDLIRNGLSHDYFPRGAISRNGWHPAINKGKTFDIVLDAETLVIDFITSLDVFKEKLEDEKYEKRMQETLEKIAKFKKTHKSYIDNLELHPNDDENATPSAGAPPDDGTETHTARGSSASGATGSMNTTTDPTQM